MPYLFRAAVSYHTVQLLLSFFPDDVEMIALPLHHRDLAATQRHNTLLSDPFWC